MRSLSGTINRGRALRSFVDAPFEICSRNLKKKLPYDGERDMGALL